MMLTNNPNHLRVKRLKNWGTGFAFLITCVFTSFYLIEPHFVERQLYRNAELIFDRAPDLLPNRYAIKESDSVFLFNASTPDKSKFRIQFGTSAKVTVSIEAEYTSLRCNGSGIDSARLHLRGALVYKSFSLIRNQPVEVTTDIREGSELRVIMSNKSNANCGQARITLYKAEDKWKAHVIYLLQWLLVLLLCLTLRVSAGIALMGAIFNTAILAADASLGGITLDSIFTSSYIALAFTGLLFLLSAFPIKSILLTIAVTVCVTVGVSFFLVFIVHNLVFGAPASADTVHAIMQTYPEQAKEFWLDNIGLSGTILYSILVVCLYLAVNHINKFGCGRVPCAVLGGLLVFNGLIVWNYSFPGNRSINLVTDSVYDYRNELQMFKKVASGRRKTSLDSSLKSDFKNTKTVVIIGESVNKAHMSAYGYTRDTTPNIDHRIKSGQVTQFTNAYSNHVHSNPTASLMLTAANQYNGLRWISAPSIFNYTAAAGVKTKWISNHKFLGGWSNHITAIAREADSAQTINSRIGTRSNESSSYDGGLIQPFIRDFESGESQLTFLHFYNSHGSYCRRFPESERKNFGEIKRYQFGKVTSNATSLTKYNINCYDSTIYYTDQLLEIVINFLESRSEPTSLIYIADHGEDVVNALAHNAATFSFAMPNIPMFVWANESWRKAHPEKWNSLNNNRQEVFTNDLLFETVLGIAGISADNIDLTNDISSVKYSPPSSPLTLHGKVMLSDPENWHYWQYVNSGSTINKDLCSSADSIGEARYVLSLGINTIDLKANYTQKGELKVFSDHKDSEALKIEQFIELVRGYSPSKIRLDLDNADGMLRNQLEKRIAELQNKHSISLEILDADDQNSVTPLTFDSPNFQQQLFNQSNNGCIPVSVKSVYKSP